MKILAADVGGTKTLLLLAELHGGVPRVLAESRFSSPDFDGLAPLVQAFCHRQGLPSADIDRACFGVAGPVTGDSARLTHLPWVLDAGELARSLGIRRVRLINDFQAVGHGLDALEASELVVLQEGRVEARGTRVLIGAGTGLGEGVLVWQQDGYEPLASEGGHVDFGPTDETQLALAAWLLRRLGRASYNDILCGPGLVRLHEFLRESGRHPQSEALERALAGAEDRAPVITDFALNRKDPAARAALDLFVQIYGAQAGNLALTCVARGGVYIAGGIAPRIIEALKAGGFIRAFNHKGPMTPLAESMRVAVVMNTRVGLLGALRCAQRL